ncbi:MAG: hypothetical protein ABI743_10210 [bacterium]
MLTKLATISKQSSHLERTGQGGNMEPDQWQNLVIGLASSLVAVLAVTVIQWFMAKADRDARAKEAAADCEFRANQATADRRATADAAAQDRAHQAEEAAKDRDFRAEQARAERLTMQRLDAYKRWNFLMAKLPAFDTVLHGSKNEEARAWIESLNELRPELAILAGEPLKGALDQWYSAQQRSQFKFLQFMDRTIPTEVQTHHTMERQKAVDQLPSLTMQVEREMRIELGAGQDDREQSMRLHENP